MPFPDSLPDAAPSSPSILGIIISKNGAIILTMPNVIQGLLPVIYRVN